MTNPIKKIRALAGQAIELPALKFRDGVDKVTRSQTEGMLSQLTRGEKVTIRAVASFGARVFSGSDFEGWEQTRNFAPWQRATADGGDGRLLEFIAVSEGVKRDGSTIRVDGIDTTNLARNPVFLWVHNSDSNRPPIGRIVAMRKVDDLEAGRVLMIRVAPLATTDGTEHIDFARMIFNMFENGDMHAVSFGWVPTEYDVMHDAEGYFVGFDFLKSDALEVSAVPTPADPDALKKECTYRSAVSQYPDKFTTKREQGVFILRDGVELGPLFRAMSDMVDPTGSDDTAADGAIVAALAVVRTAVKGLLAAVQADEDAEDAEEGAEGEAEDDVAADQEMQAALDNLQAAVDRVAAAMDAEEAAEDQDETTEGAEGGDRLCAIFAGPVREALTSTDYAPVLRLVREMIQAGADADAVYAAVESERDAANREREAAEEAAARIAGLFGDKTKQGQRAGKVLSRKNRDSVQAAHDACTAATVTLRDLLDATNEAADAEESDEDSGRALDALRVSAANLARTAGTDEASVLADMKRAADRMAALVPARKSRSPYDSLFASSAKLAAAAGQ